MQVTFLQSLLDSLLVYDEALFLWLHHNLTADWADLFFPVITDLHKTWPFRFIFVPGVLFFSIYYFRRWGFFFLTALILSTSVADAVGGKILKPAFDRPRPNEAGIHAVIKAPHYGGKSFPSNHAANMFALATFLSLVFRRGSVIFFATACLVGYSRIYCGVHYPLDVLGGALLGCACGGLSYYALRYFSRRYDEKLKLGTPKWLMS